MKVTRLKEKAKIEIPFFMDRFEFYEMNGSVEIRVFNEDFKVEIETDVIEVLADLGHEVVEKKIKGLEDEYDFIIEIDGVLLDDESETILDKEDIEQWLISQKVILDLGQEFENVIK